MRKFFRGFLALGLASQIVLAAAAPVFAQTNVICIGALAGMTVQNVEIPQGATCSLTDMTVLGNVEASPFSTVTVRRGSVNGDIIAEASSTVRLIAGRISGGVAGFGANLININGTTIAIDVTAEETASLVVSNGANIGSIEMLKGGSASVIGARLRGGIKFEENTGAITANRNTVAGNFEAFLNLGGATFRYNTITGNMQCKENLPAPVGVGNIAVSKEDQCATL